MQDKAGLRRELLRRRDHIPPVVRKVKDREIEARLYGLDEFISAKVIFFFASFRTEADTSGMITKSLQEGRKVILPKVEGKDLGLYEIKGIAELRPGYMDIPEPSVLSDDRRADINEVDLIIIPGAAFDEAGNRIGYGGGYYDRLLSGLQKDIPVVAPAYEEQVEDCIPSEPHDIRVQMIVTDRRVIRCNQ